MTEPAGTCATCAQLRAELAAERAARLLALVELAEAWRTVELLLLQRMPGWPTQQ